MTGRGGSWGLALVAGRAEQVLGSLQLLRVLRSRVRLPQARAGLSAHLRGMVMAGGCSGPVAGAEGACSQAGWVWGHLPRPVRGIPGAEAVEAGLGEALPHLPELMKLEP